MAVELRLLGAAQALVDGRPVVLGFRRQRLVLAILALEVGRQVPLDRLVELMWPDGPTPTAAHAVRVSVSGLRAALGSAVEIVTQGTGYRLAADPSTVDAYRFRSLLAAARKAAGDAERVSMLNQALALWTGPALEGTAPPETRDRLCAGLEEARLVALEDRAEVMLRLGRHGELADELADLTATYPLRERLAAERMLALYRCGRPADALAVYHRVRDELAEQLGLDPGAELRRFEVAILRDEDPLPRPAAGGLVFPPPAQLPGAVTGFVGRACELAGLSAIAGSGVRVVVIVGTAGVGKTALAAHWADAHRDRYPDGQLYVNLRGWGPGSPLRPEQVLDGFLRGLGVPAEQIPLDLEQAGALYRTLLADRRMLVVLDNAVGVDQVRPLLPSGGGCLAVVTSRDRLTGLVVRDGARLLRLDTLGADESVALLVGQSGGGARLAAHPGSVAELARLCGYLPLALRIAAAQLARHPNRPVADLVARLRDGDRLAALEVEGDEQSAVRATLDLSYVALKPHTRRLFRLAGLVPGADLTGPAAVALMGQPGEAEVMRSLAQLTEAHLLDEPVPGRYLMHDLLRLYARSLTRAEDGAAEREAAACRLYEFYLRTCDRAARLLYPQMQRLPLAAPAVPVAPVAFADAAAALAWLEVERGNLLAAVEQAAAEGPGRYAWSIVDSLRGYFWMRRYPAQWLTAGRAALRASTMDTDDAGRAAAHLSLAQAYRLLARHDEAVEHFGRAVAAAARAGWRPGEAAATGSLANLYYDRGRLNDSAAYHQRAREIFHELGEAGGEAVSLANLGAVLVESGALTEGTTHLMGALDLYRRIGVDSARAHVLTSLGGAYRYQGRLVESLEQLEQALALHRQAGSREGEADTLNNLAETHLGAGRPGQARLLAQESLAIAEDTGDGRVEADACHTLATLERAAGRAGTAWDERSLAVADASGNARAKALALIGLSRDRLAAGARAEANATARTALDTARRAGYRLIEEEAAATLAETESPDRRGDQSVIQ